MTQSKNFYIHTRPVLHDRMNVRNMEPGVRFAGLTVAQELHSIRVFSVLTTVVHYWYCQFVLGSS